MAEALSESKANDNVTSNTKLEFVETNSIVIDNGSYHIKAGHGGDSLPRVVEANVVGRSKDKETLHGAIAENSDFPNLELSYPMKYQLVQNWEDMESVWNYVLTKKLKVNPSEQDVLLTEAALVPTENREKSSEIFFEKFNVVKFYRERANKLSLYATGRQNGITLDVGHEITHFVPIVDGHEVLKGIRRVIGGGLTINDYLHKLLTEKGYSFKSKKTVERIKESLCYISTDYDNELKAYKKDKQYELPDGKVVNIGSERIQCGEVLFNPSMFPQEFESKGIIDSIKESVDVFDDKNQQQMLYSNINLAGGSTLFKGFDERIEYDISKMIDKDQKVRVINHSDRRYSAFIGGSILASLSTFQSKYITKMEYDEHGASIVTKKCT
eukprot:197730_1